jgi:hypothetical protein
MRALIAAPILNNPDIVSQPLRLSATPHKLLKCCQLQTHDPRSEWHTTEEFAADEWGLHKEK